MLLHVLLGLFVDLLRFSRLWPQFIAVDVKLLPRLEVVFDQLELLDGGVVLGAVEVAELLLARLVGLD